MRQGISITATPINAYCNNNKDSYICIQLFRERLSEKMCTRQSRKVIWDMINTLFLSNLLCCFPLALENTFPWPFVPILSNFFEERRTQNHPQYLLGLSRALFPTTFLEIAVYKPGYTRNAVNCTGKIRK